MHLQTEDGGFEAILPPEDLAAIHGRIMASELAVKDQVASIPTASHTAANAGRPPLNVRLAAAMGITSLLLPFRSPLQHKLQCAGAYETCYEGELVLPLDRCRFTVQLTLPPC